jgi:hypothetical protein
MDRHSDLLIAVRRSAQKRVLFLPHAIRQMSRPDRMITTEEIRRIIQTGEIVEDYPEDQRGHSCLLLGSGHGGRPVHVVCAPKEDYLAVITAYLPDPNRWSEDFRRRTES